MKQLKRFVFFLLVVLIIWFAGHLFSGPVSEKGKISLENFIYCHIQVIEVVDDTGIGRAVKIRDLEQVEKLVDSIEGLEVRKALPWEKMHEEFEYPYSVQMQYDSEEMGRYEIIHFWKNGEIVFRGDSYMIAEGSKTKMTDQLEWFLQNYETEE